MMHTGQRDIQLPPRWAVLEQAMREIEAREVIARNETVYGASQAQSGENDSSHGQDCRDAEMRAGDRSGNQSGSPVLSGTAGEAAQRGGTR